MCGISFYCLKGSSPLSELRASLTTMSHRGPDASGFTERKISGYSIGLGHCRLSIVDLSDAGSQPMVSPSGVLLTYNGEIYNHVELRGDLVKKGYVFEGESDTEVLLNLFVEYGVDCFRMLKGMFAFTILDERTEELFVVRDVVGVKPLYLFDGDDGLYGASEMKALKCFHGIPFLVDSDDLFEFFNTGFLYEPATGFTDIKKLMPGHYLQLDLKTGDKVVRSYAKAADFYNEERFSDTIESAIKTQEVADVPLGTFFSGGIDSSILAVAVDNNELLFAKYESDPAADVDLEFSEKISAFLNKKLSTVEIGVDGSDRESILASIDFVALNSEEMVSDYTFWATYKLSQAAKSAGYTVMLSGMGGDEVFAGYPRYSILKNHRWVKLSRPLLKFMWKFKLYPNKYAKKFERLLSYAEEPMWATAYSRMLGYMSQSDLAELFDDFGAKQETYSSRLNGVLASYDGDASDKVKMAQHMDMTGFLSHNLSVSDKASMLASIELRVPLLDESVVAAGVSFGSKKLMCDGVLKFPLKEFLFSLLPKSMLDRPKTGFNPPLDGLIMILGKEFLESELASLSSSVSIDRVKLILDQHFSGAANNTYKIWQLFYISRWLKFNS